MLAVGFLFLGAVFIGVAFLLLVEYKRVFFTDPRSILSFEVLAQIFGLGGPGYLAVICGIIGAILFVVGVLAAVAILDTHLFEFMKRLFPA